MYLFKKILNIFPRPLLIKISFIVRPFLSVYYRGKKYTDPIDGKSFRKFLPYGYTKQRTNVLSPSTLSLERHRLLWLFLQRKTQFFQENIKVLHFAPEQAFYHRFKKQTNLTYITTDLHSPLADIQADICNLPFENNSFDVILCNHVLEHIPDDKKAMQELYRILKPKGWAIIQVPLDTKRNKTFSDDSITNPKERSEIFGQYDHLRIYGMDFFQKLEKEGFQVTPYPCQKIVSDEEIEKFCLDFNEILPFCQKNS